MLISLACNNSIIETPSTYPIDPSIQDSTDSEVPIITEPTPTSLSNRIEGVECITEYENRELNNQPEYADPIKFTLSEDELREYFTEMEIQDFCIPKQLGFPFLNVDVNALELPSTRGRMISIGFENTYPGGGWGDVYIIYATYDLEVGMEYDIFASKADFEAVGNGTIPNIIEVSGRRAFVRYTVSVPMGLQNIYKTIIFPAENDYFGIVYNLGAFNPEEVEGLLEEFNTNGYTNSSLLYLEIVSYLVQSLSFE